VILPSTFKLPLISALLRIVNALANNSFPSKVRLLDPAGLLEASL
jgi:hypothetical protein